MNDKRLKFLSSTDKNASKKLEEIDVDLLILEADFVGKICEIADSADLDRRITLIAALRVIESLWDEMIITL